jgi:hypothetical protein
MATPDISRQLFQPEKRYVGIFMQQGRVVTDGISTPIVASMPKTSALRSATSFARREARITASASAHRRR